jgi:ribosomal protein S18 acetylase RimI-like enzyme
MSEAQPEIGIREGSASDHAICAEILSRAWNSALPTRPRRVGVREFREQTLDELVLVAVSGREPVGFISVWKPSWFVHHLFVDPAFQGRNIGSRLLGHIAALAGEHEMGLKCQIENRAAIRFYERHGFQCTALRGSDEFGEWVELRRCAPESSGTR